VAVAESAQSALLRALAAYSLGALLLPALAIVEDTSSGTVLAAFAGVMFATVVAALIGSRVSQARFAWLGGLVVFTAAWLIPQTSQAGITLVLGLIIGLGLGLAAPDTAQLRDRLAARLLAIGVLQFALLALIAPDSAVVIGGALYGLAMLMLTLAGPSHRRPPASSTARVTAAGAVLLTLFTTCWVGANSLTASWFGSLVNHGPRQQRRIALTFDDGPNSPYTLEVRDIVDRYGAKATFFTVGKALDARPEISRALMSDGQLLANHSYLHDSLRWLDPRYPELERTQRAFKRNLGVCPTFFRPPHGQHTPFMADVAEDHGMTMVGWDDSGGDWATHDPDLVASRILHKVRPGSIILLHDGLDGNLTADRSVLLRALPLILDGLKARDLRAVRLDTLLGKPGYGDHC
jgi:peptidoglycan/xylan/chitin deacetylase (PgdA/CDA1 family)